MRIVLTVPEEILREACKRIALFCNDHIVSRETLKEIENDLVTVSSENDVICDNDTAHVA